MITYNQAFDYYHAIYRIAMFLVRLQQGQSIELDRLRIWDFYLLFPESTYSIRLKQDEKEIRELRKAYVRNAKNPYNEAVDERKVFEKLKPYQMMALSCLASYGIINKDLLKENRVQVLSPQKLHEYVSNFEEPSALENNIISFMTMFFSTISMFGPDGLKSRTKLMVSKYDL